ncbi:MAG: glycoside hydrolase family 127 protein [Clostridia bacterium]|nr:glycoside hydrolase family 127 protein [Clostridia bacterium]
MKTYSLHNVDLTGGYLYEKQNLNRNITIPTVYDRFFETGRVKAFNFDYKKGDELMPHFYWDSDMAKWIEGAAYTLVKGENPYLSERVDDLVEKIKKNQGEDGYFNIYYTVVEPSGRFTDRNNHELYCAGHLMEAAVAHVEATGKTDFLECMEKYADYINRVFIEEKSASFFTPGHEEIELALVRMYRHTGKKKYLDMAAYFVNTRGAVDEQIKTFYNQSHVTPREQSEAVGHAVRALYLYTGMAYLAKETGDEGLLCACKTLWDDITKHKMYITGGVGSTAIGEAFTTPYDLPNDTAYAETCAAIALMFFANAMLDFENDAKYADVIERALYNGVLSGLSVDGKRFFYTNPLEINVSEQYENSHGVRALPITQRPPVFDCSCCPPNINRLLASLGNYIYGQDGDTLFVNQFISSKLNAEGVSAEIVTQYPIGSSVTVSASGVSKIAVRIPSWCNKFEINKPYTLERGYAVIDNDGSKITLSLDMTPTAVYANTKVMRDAGRLAIMRGPIVYCAEGVDNGPYLHDYLIPSDFTYTENMCESFGLIVLNISAYKRINQSEELYSHKAPMLEKAELKLIPYSCFANRGESDMLVWFFAK